MNSLKTGVIIAFGLTVLYGVYLVINKPEPSPEAQAAAEQTPDLNIGEMGEEEASTEAKLATEDDVPLERDPAAAEVASAGKHSSKFARHRAESATDVEDPAEPEPETTERMDAQADPETTEPAWRKKPDRATEPEVEKEEEPSAQPDANSEESSKTAERDSTENEPVAKSETTKADTSDEPETTGVKEEAQDEVKAAPHTAPALTTAEFDAAWTKMEAEIEEGKLKEALTTISPFYHAVDLSDDDYKHLVEVLDLLAWRVIFSKEHFLAKPHIVKASETLEDIAQRYRVPSEVIMKINGVKSARLLTAGTELKVVPGPFRAEVSTETGELTLFLGDLYATRYALESGTEPPPEAGEYSVIDRTPGAVYPTIDNRRIAAQDKRNPYGGYYLDLGNGQCLHGSPEVEQGEALGSGCMRLRGKDAKEVYWLLSKGSKVTVLR